MDYPEICGLRDRDGNELLIIAGVSVTRTLPHGTPDDVRRELIISLGWTAGGATGLKALGKLLEVSTKASPDLPAALTAAGCVDTLITDRAVFRLREGKLTLTSIYPGERVEAVLEPLAVERLPVATELEPWPVGAPQQEDHHG